MDYHRKLCLHIKEIRNIKEKHFFYIEMFTECFSDFLYKNINKKKEEKCSMKNDNKVSEEKLYNEYLEWKKENQNKVEEDEDVITESVMNMDENKEKEPVSEFSKKLKKKISLLTHPDIVKGKEEIFDKMIQAYDEGNILELLYISDILDIDIPNNLEDDIYEKLIEKLIEDKQNIIKSNCWVWFENEDLRDILRKGFSKEWGISIQDIIITEEKFEKKN